MRAPRFAGGSHSGETSGDTQILSDQLYQYDPAENRWQEAMTLPYPVAGAALVADGNMLYLLGGWDGQKMRVTLRGPARKIQLGSAFPPGTELAVVQKSLRP